MAKKEEPSVKVCPFCGDELIHVPRRTEKGNQVGWVYMHSGYNRCIVGDMELRRMADIKNWNTRNGEKVEELEYMRNFIVEGQFDSEICREQLRSLWTAYCIHHDIDVDTLEYDRTIWSLWDFMALNDTARDFWSRQMAEFDMFMCKYLV